MGFKFIEETLREKYPDVDVNQHIWNELINVNNEYEAGWHNLIIELIGKIEEIYKKNNVDISEFKIDEIREKYGQLRFDAVSSISEVYNIISQYENKADTICDQCGEKGSLCEKNGWLETLCEKCAYENGYTKVK